MACPAAIAAVHRVLPFNPPGTQTYRKPLCGFTASEVWRKIRWWTPATIQEALNELVQRGDAEYIGEPRFPLEIKYRAKVAPHSYEMGKRYKR